MMFFSLISFIIAALITLFDCYLLLKVQIFGELDFDDDDQLSAFISVQLLLALAIWAILYLAAVWLIAIIIVGIGAKYQEDLKQKKKLRDE